MLATWTGIEHGVIWACGGLLLIVAVLAILAIFEHKGW